MGKTRAPEPCRHLPRNRRLRLCDVDRPRVRAGAGAETVVNRSGAWAGRRPTLRTDALREIWKERWVTPREKDVC